MSTGQQFSDEQIRARRRSAVRTALVLAAVAVAIYAWAIVSRL